MKIYTRTGDGGDTGLFGEERVPKDDARVEAYGAVDEANAALGLARSLLANSLLAKEASTPADARSDAGGEWADLDVDLESLQSLLFDLGSDLATPLNARQRRLIRPVGADDVTAVEATIDRYDAELPALTHFVLPGGSDVAAALHLARTVVRRAERAAVTAGRQHELNPEAMRLLNRVSDLLFTLARVANARASVAEVAWHARS